MKRVLLLGLSLASSLVSASELKERDVIYETVYTTAWSTYTPDVIYVTETVYGQPECLYVPHTVAEGASTTSVVAKSPNVAVMPEHSSVQEHSTAHKSGRHTRGHHRKPEVESTVSVHEGRTVTRSDSESDIIAPHTVHETKTVVQHPSNVAPSPKPSKVSSHTTATQSVASGHVYHSKLIYEVVKIIGTLSYTSGSSTALKPTTITKTTTSTSRLTGNDKDTTVHTTNIVTASHSRPSVPTERSEVVIITVTVPAITTEVGNTRTVLEEQIVYYTTTTTSTRTLHVTPTVKPTIAAGEGTVSTTPRYANSSSYTANIAGEHLSLTETSRSAVSSSLPVPLNSSRSAVSSSLPVPLNSTILSSVSSTASSGSDGLLSGISASLPSLAPSSRPNNTTHLSSRLPIPANATSRASLTVLPLPSSSSVVAYNSTTSVVTPIEPTKPLNLSLAATIAPSSTPLAINTTESATMMTSALSASIPSNTSLSTASVSPSAAPSIVATSTQHSSPDFIDTVLNEHNYLRSLTGAPDLAWNSTLADIASNYSQYCVFEHSSLPYGENLATGGFTNPAYYVYLWYNEVNEYDFNNPGFSNATGHFTQLAWQSTSQVGCAWASGCDQVNTEYPYYLVCEYFYPGNIAGQYSDNVARPTGNATVPAKMA